MTLSRLETLIAERGCLLLDGAMGTELFARGLVSGDPPEAWNVDHPERVAAVHRAYVEAGSDMFLTNSFGGTAFRLSLHDLHERVEELNEAAARIGRSVADDAAITGGRTVLVAGSMGPSGELLEPMGAMTMDSCAEAFARQATGLAAGGADVLWIETMSHLDEVAAAIEGAQSACDLPIAATLSFDTAGRTMMGVSGTAAAERLRELGVTAIGANCGNNLADTEAAIAEMRAVDSELILVSKANAGMPEWHGTELHYSGSPDVMAAHAHRQRTAGVQIIGGCCGSSPDHITMMRAVMDGDIEPPEVEFEPAVLRQVVKKSDDAEGSSRRRRGRRRS